MTPVGVAFPELKWWRNTEDLSDRAYMLGDTTLSIWSLRQLSSRSSSTFGRRPPAGTRQDTSCSGYRNAVDCWAPDRPSGATIGMSSPRRTAWLWEFSG